MEDHLRTARLQVLDRVEELPSAVKDCERCGGSGNMLIRRSSLNEQFLADDIGLKCKDCYYYATHGVPFHDEDGFLWELHTLRNNKRVLDFGWDGFESTPEENLEALGYIAASKKGNN